MTSLSPRGSSIVNLWLASERLSARADQGLGALHGLSFLEYVVLLQLHRSPDQRMRRVDLAMAIGRTASGVTRLLRPMEKIGLVSRDSSERDARVSLVKLTAAGAQKLSDATTTMNDMSQRLTQVIGDSQLDSLTTSLSVLRE